MELTLYRGTAEVWVNKKNIKQVMNIIKQLLARVVFLQETHMIKEDVVKIERRWHGQVFSACYTKQARGL